MKVMVISRRKRIEDMEISICMNTKMLEQLQKIKYLGIIFVINLNFREHIIHISSKCNKLIHALSKSEKLSWFLSHAAFHIINKGAILPFFLYGAPVWLETLKK